MCGILFSLFSADQTKFRHSLQLIRHRGPDAEGIFIDEFISLGHRRLSIIGLSESCNQPMSVADRYQIVFNGEIYNYIELRDELKQLGHSFKTDSDTEVIVVALHEWKENALKKFNGMWSFVVYDQLEKSIFISRDRLGKKPLYCTKTNQGFVFASEMKALYPWLNEINIDHTEFEFAKKNNFHYESRENCLIENIKRFPAGSFFKGKITDDIRPVKFWELSFGSENFDLSYQQTLSKLKELMLDSCKIRTRSDVPISTALSGGIDSSIVVCSLSHLKKNKEIAHQPKAFIASFPNTHLDETEFAMEVVQHTNAEYIIEEIDPVKEIDRIFEYTYYFEDLYPTTPIPFILVYKKMREAGFKVSLDGHGGDELFAGYPWDVFSAKHDAFPGFADLKNVLNTYYSMIGSHKVSTREIAGTWWQLLKTHQNFKSKDALGERLHEAVTRGMLPTLLRNYDRYSMINNVEIRMPILDYRIVEFAMSIPWYYKVKDGFAKKVFRDAFKEILPEKIHQRKSKIGFGTPFNSWAKTSIKSWVLDLLHSNNFGQSTLINAQQVKEETEKVLNGKSERDIYSMLTPYIWEQSLKEFRKY